jgi:integrase/recombinase XerC
MDLQGFRAKLELDDKSGLTIRNYVTDVEMFADWYGDTYGEEFDPGRIVQREVSDYRAWMQGQSAAAETINRRLTSLRQYFAYVGRTPNPAVGVRGVKIVDPGVQALTMAQLRRLLREVHVHQDIRDIAILEVLCGTGIRVGELVALRVGDVEISERRGSLVVRCGKGRVARHVPLNGDVRKALAAWLEVHPGDSDALFVGQRGPLTAVGIWRIVRKYGDYAGIHELRVHQLRHTVITRMVRELGMDLATVARISGHRCLSSVLRYAAPTREDLERAMAGLELTGGD